METFNTEERPFVERAGEGQFAGDVRQAISDTEAVRLITKLPPAQLRIMENRFNQAGVFPSTLGAYLEGVEEAVPADAVFAVVNDMCSANEMADFERSLDQLIGLLTTDDLATAA